MSRVIFKIRRVIRGIVYTMKTKMRISNEERPEDFYAVMREFYNKEEYERYDWGEEE